MRKIKAYENKVNKPCCEDKKKEPCKKCGEKKFNKIEPINKI